MKRDFRKGNSKSKDKAGKKTSHQPFGKQQRVQSDENKGIKKISLEKVSKVDDLEHLPLVPACWFYSGT